MTGRHRAERPRSRRRFVPFVVLVVLALAGLTAALLVTTGGDGGDSTTAAATPSLTVPPSTPAASPSASATRSAAPATRKPTPARRVTRPPRPAPTLAVTVTGSASYLRVAVPGGPVLVDQVLPHGRSVAYRQPALDVVIGDAGAVRLAVRGRVSSPAGRPGEVLRFAIRPPR